MYSTVLGASSVLYSTLGSTVVADSLAATFLWRLAVRRWSDGHYQLGVDRDLLAERQKLPLRTLGRRAQRLAA